MPEGECRASEELTMSQLLWLLLFLLLSVGCDRERRGKVDRQEEGKNKSSLLKWVFLFTPERIVVCRIGLCYPHPDKATTSKLQPCFSSNFPISCLSDAPILGPKGEPRGPRWAYCPSMVPSETQVVSVITKPLAYLSDAKTLICGERVWLRDANKLLNVRYNCNN